MTLATFADPGTVAAASGALHVVSTPTADVYAVADTVKRIVSVRLFWNAVPGTEPLAQAGRTAATLSALVRDSDARSGVPLAQQLEAAGVVCSVGVADTSVHIELRGARNDTRSAVALLAGGLGAGGVGEPAFLAGRTATRHEVERRGHDLRTVAIDALRGARFGSAARASVPPEGTPAGLTGLTHDDVDRTAKELLTRARLHVLVAGDPDVQSYVDLLAPWQHDRGPLAEPEPPAAHLVPAPPAQLTVASPLRGQAHVLWGTVVPLADAADYVALELVTHVLGGWVGSRWHSLFREKLGLTYGTYSAAVPIGFGDGVVGLAYAGFSVAQAALAQTTDQLSQQVGALPDVLDDVELRSAAAQLLRAEALHHDSARSLIGRAGLLLQGGLAVTMVGDRVAAMRETTGADLRRRLDRLLRQSTLVRVSE